MDNFNPELASSAIAILKVCIHDVIISRRKTEESLGMKRSDSGRRPLSLEILERFPSEWKNRFSR